MNTSASAKKAIPIGLELWTVRTDLKKDLKGTVTAVAKMGYELVEFYSTYLDWPIETAKDVRTLLDDLGIGCRTTHNGLRAFTSDALQKTAELNHILGSTSLILASVPPVADMDGWKTMTDRFTVIAEDLRPFNLRAGLHNHQKEWTPIDGVRPIDVVAAGTPPDFVLQLDVGACVEAGADPVAFIHANPGRFRSIHCKDWNRTKGYRIAFGEGDCPWKDVFEAAETGGGVDAYLIEQGESSPEEEFDMARRGIDNWKRLHA